jgi:hypothetical protein
VIGVEHRSSVPRHVIGAAAGDRAPRTRAKQMLDVCGVVRGGYRRQACQGVGSPRRGMFLVESGPLAASASALSEDSELSTRTRAHTRTFLSGCCAMDPS